MASPFDAPAFRAITERMHWAWATLYRHELYERAQQALAAAERRGDRRTLTDFLRVEVQREIDAAGTTAHGRGAGRAWAGQRPSPEVDHRPPLLRRADELDAQGAHYAARALRQEQQAVEHRQLRAEVEAEVARRESVHKWISQRHGPARADEYRVSEGSPPVGVGTRLCHAWPGLGRAGARVQRLLPAHRRGRRGRLV